MKTKLNKFGIAFLAASAFALVAPADYLFVHFRDEIDETCEQAHFSVSTDGVEWYPLNGGKAVLTSNVGERGTRDHFILQDPDGTYHLIATDLCIFRNNNWGRAVWYGSRSLVVWDSKDLLDWSEPRLVEVAPKNAGCTWAPEAVYDGKRGEWLVFWSSSLKVKGADGKEVREGQRVFGAWTKDFKTFSAPFPWIDAGRDGKGRQLPVIDTTCVREGDTWYRFTKDEKVKNVRMEKCDDLLGSWERVAYPLEKLTGYEGPTCYPVKDGWVLMLDHFGRHEGYKPFFTRSLANPDFLPLKEYRYHAPFLLRHGSAIRITPEQRKALVEKYGISGTEHRSSDGKTVASGEAQS